MGGTREVWIAATALASVLAAQEVAAQAKSGVVQVKIADVNAQLPGGKITPLHIGDAVFADQKITTGPNGRAKLIMLDRSALLVGPNSDITIESFEFDQSQSVGSMTIEAAKGLFRFVGGLVSKRRPVQIRTRVGTIGIRGAVVVINFTENGGLEIFFMYGNEATFDPDTGGEAAHLNQPGYKMTIDPSGNTSVSVASVTEMDGVLRNLEGAPGSELPGVANVQPINQVNPQILELLETDASDVETRIDEIHDGSDVTFDDVLQTLDDLAVEAAGTGGM